MGTDATLTLTTLVHCMKADLPSLAFEQLEVKQFEAAGILLICMAISKDNGPLGSYADLRVPARKNQTNS